MIGKMWFMDGTNGKIDMGIRNWVPVFTFS